MDDISVDNKIRNQHKSRRDDILVDKNNWLIESRRDDISVDFGQQSVNNIDLWQTHTHKFTSNLFLR